MEPSLHKNICEERLYERFFKSQAKALRNYLYVKFGTMDLAEDLMQEAFIKLWNNCTKVTPNSAKSYVYKVAVNLGISQKRHESVKFRYKDMVIKKDHSITIESPEFLFLEEEFKEKLTHVISNLPNKQREVFLLNRVEQKTYKEIAELSEVSVKAIEKTMHKALLKIREALGEFKF